MNRNLPIMIVLQVFSQSNGWKHPIKGWIPDNYARLRHIIVSILDSMSCKLMLKDISIYIIHIQVHIWTSSNFLFTFPNNRPYQVFYQAPLCAPVEEIEVWIRVLRTPTSGILREFFSKGSKWTFEKKKNDLDQMTCFFKLGDFEHYFTKILDIPLHVESIAWSSKAATTVIGWRMKIALCIPSIGPKKIVPQIYVKQIWKKHQ